MLVSRIETMDDMKLFAKQIVVEELNFHPDTDFSDYINGHTRMPFYSEEAAAIRNELVNQCFALCEAENMCVYETLHEYINKERKRLGLFYV